MNVLLIKFRLRYLLLNAQTRWYELLNPSYIEHIQKNDIEPIFIVGSGRSGNTLLARILHESGDVCFAPENFTLWETYRLYLKNINKSWNEKVDLVIDKLLSQKDSFRWEKVDISELKEVLYFSDEQTLGNIIDKWYVNYSKNIDYPTNRWGCKTPNLTPHIHNFIKIFPNMKLVYIVRKPSDVIASFLKADIENIDSIITSIVHWKFFNDFMLSNTSDIDVIIDYDKLIINKQAKKILYNLLKLQHKEFIAFQNEDMNYKHLKNINTKIEQKANNKDQIIFNIYDDFYEKRFKKLSHI